MFCVNEIHYAATLLDPTKRNQLTPSEILDAVETIYSIATNSSDLDIEVIMSELAAYNSKDGFFGKPFLWACSKTTPALTWWKGLCSTQQLCKVALKVLGAPATSAAVERSFSKHSFIQSKVRNRLTNTRAEKLVYISSNLKLLGGNQKKEKKEKKNNTTETDAEAGGSDCEMLPDEAEDYEDIEYLDVDLEEGEEDNEDSSLDDDASLHLDDSDSESVSDSE